MNSRYLPLILAALAGTASQPAAAAGPAWTLSDVTAGVLVRHAGVMRPAHRGMTLSGGDVIMTSGNARAMLVRGEEYAIVAPGTQLSVSADGGADGLTQFVETFGNVVFSVKKMLSPHFSVGTPYLAAVVKGTTFGVSVDNHSTSVQVLEGAVQVSNAAGATALVRPGTIGKAEDDSTDLLLTGAERRVVSAPLTVAGVSARAANTVNSVALGTLRTVLPASAGSPELVLSRIGTGAGAAGPGLLVSGLFGLLVAAGVFSYRAYRRRRDVHARDDLTSTLARQRLAGAAPKRYGETGPSL